jgi:hypothetical protein
MMLMRKRSGIRMAKIRMKKIKMATPIEGKRRLYLVGRTSTIQMARRLRWECSNHDNLPVLSLFVSDGDLGNCVSGALGERLERLLQNGGVWE